LAMRLSFKVNSSDFVAPISLILYRKITIDF
jgi:hypothetical protein